MKIFQTKGIQSIVFGLALPTLGNALPSTRSTPGANSSSSTPRGSLSGPSGTLGAPPAPSAKMGDYIELDESMRSEMYGTIDFPNAELKDIVKAISKLASKNFILDRKLENRRVTILSPQPVTKQ